MDNTYMELVKVFVALLGAVVTYYVIPCKYYKTLGKRWNGCKYLGIITDDFVFDDQCKMCGQNYGDDASQYCA